MGHLSPFPGPVGPLGLQLHRTADPFSHPPSLRRPSRSNPLLPKLLQQPQSWGPPAPPTPLPHPGLVSHRTTEMPLNMSDQRSPLLRSLSAPHLPPTQNLSPSFCNGQHLGPQPTLPLLGPDVAPAPSSAPAHWFLRGLQLRTSFCPRDFAPADPTTRTSPSTRHVFETIRFLWVSAQSSLETDGPLPADSP